MMVYEKEGNCVGTYLISAVMAENVSAEQVDLQTQNNKVSQQRNLLVLVSEWTVNRYFVKKPNVIALKQVLIWCQL